MTNTMRNPQVEWRPRQGQPSPGLWILSFLIFWSAFIDLSSSSLAADKSGVGPNSISLPKGPGSIEGLGESFQPSLNTGTANYGVALKLPPGVAGHAPSLSLA